jgi:hypothetical protein
MWTTKLGVSDAPLNMAKNFVFIGERVVARDAGNHDREQGTARALRREVAALRPIGRQGRT